MSLQILRRQADPDQDVVSIRGVLCNEPIFPIRARDLLALPTIDEYLRLCVSLRLMKAESVRRAIREIEAWQSTHPQGIVGNDHAHVDARDQYRS